MLAAEPPAPVIVICGPTATGKTRVGATVAKALQTEVISTDSQLVYPDLNIGVAKPTPDEMQGIPHHGIGFMPMTELCSAGYYAESIGPTLESILGTGKSPVLVGGTGFYIRALIQPNAVPAVPVDETLRQALKERCQTVGLPALYAELQLKDPDRAADIYPQDEKRVLRALEIITLTGKPVPKNDMSFAYPVKAYGLTYRDRERQVAAINTRLQEMIDAGFLAEVECVLAKHGRCPAMLQAHGYPELLDVIFGTRTLENAVAQIAVNIRQYSKRQMTWFKKIPGITWFYVDEMSLEDIAGRIVSSV